MCTRATRREAIAERRTVASSRGLGRPAAVGEVLDIQRVESEPRRPWVVADVFVRALMAKIDELRLDCGERHTIIEEHKPAGLHGALFSLAWRKSLLRRGTTQSCRPGSWLWKKREG